MFPVLVFILFGSYVNSSFSNVWWPTSYLWRICLWENLHLF